MPTLKSFLAYLKLPSKTSCVINDFARLQCPATVSPSQPSPETLTHGLIFTLTVNKPEVTAGAPAKLQMLWLLAKVGSRGLIAAVHTC